MLEGAEGVGGVKRQGGVLGSEGPGMLRKEGVINTYFQFFLYTCMYVTEFEKRNLIMQIMNLIYVLI